MRLYIERRVLYRGNIWVLTLWFCDWQTRCETGSSTPRVNTGLQSELSPPALCGHTGAKFKNIIYTGIKTVMYEKLPLRQSLVKIGGWLAMAATNWAVSHDPVTRGGWCVTGARSRQNDKHLQYLQPGKLPAQFTLTQLSAATGRMSPVKLGVKTQKYLAQR